MLPSSPLAPSHPRRAPTPTVTVTPLHCHWPAVNHLTAALRNAPFVSEAVRRAMGAFEPASGAGGSESSRVRAAVLMGQSEADMLIAALLKIMSQLGIPCTVVGSDGDLLILECDGGTVVRCLHWQPAWIGATSTTQAAKGGAYLTRAPPPLPPCRR